MWPFRPAPPRVSAPRVEPAFPRPARRAMVVTPEMLAVAGAEPPPPTPFVIPEPLPGVLPAGVPGMAQDSAVVAGYEYASTLAGEGLTFPGYAYLAELAQRPEYRVVFETIAKEMTRKGWRLVARGSEDKGEKLAHLAAALDRYNVGDVLRRAVELDGAFGRGQVYIDLGTSNDDDEMQTPLVLSPAKITKGKLRGFRTVEPVWTYPANYNSTDPLRPDFYKPQHWYVRGRMVHSSRLLGFVSREVPDLLKPAYMFGGLSMSQMLKPYVDNWLRTRKSVADLISAFSVMVLSTDMDASLTGPSEFGGAAAQAASIIQRATLFTRTRDNRGLMMLNKTTEDLKNVSAPLGGLDHLQAQSQEHMASIAGVPLVKLLGVTPSGLNASSDGEIAVFDDSILSRQEHLFRGPLTTILQVVQLSEFGEIDPDIGFEFEPLRQMSELDRATIRRTNAEAAAVMVTAGVLAPEDERQRLADEDGGLYNGLDPSDLPEAPDDEPVVNENEPEVKADMALNGAQVSSILEIVQSVASGQMPRETAVSLMCLSFNMTAQAASALLGEVGRGFEPSHVSPNPA